MGYGLRVAGSAGAWANPLWVSPAMRAVCPENSGRDSGQRLLVATGGAAVMSGCARGSGEGRSTGDGVLAGRRLVKKVEVWCDEVGELVVVVWVATRWSSAGVGWQGAALAASSCGGGVRQPARVRG